MLEEDVIVQPETHTLKDFQEQTPSFLQQLKDTGQPLVLTVDDETGVVVQDAAAYQKLLDLVEEARAVESIRQGLADRDAGRTISLDEFKEHARRKHGISI